MAVVDIGCSWSVTTPPTIEPITLDDAKDQALITDGDADLVLTNYIATARQEAEAYLGRGLLTQTVTAVFTDFAREMPLPLAAPLQSVTTVKYYDSAGAQQTLATTVYDVDATTRPGRIVLKPGQSWPSIQSEKRNNRVEIIYVVGWTTAALVPQLIKQGIRFYVTYLEMDRSGMEVRARDALMAAQRCWSDRITWTPPRYW